MIGACGGRTPGCWNPKCEEVHLVLKIEPIRLTEEERLEIAVEAFDEIAAIDCDHEYSCDCADKAAAVAREALAKVRVGR